MRAFLMRVFSVERREVGAMLAAFAFVFCVWTSYSVLRPVRETMGITSGVANLPILFWGTLVAMLVLQPIYGFVASRYRRTTFLPWVYAFFVLNMLAFYAWFNLQEDHAWIARAFFIWLSVFNLFVLSVFWSFCVDIFTRDQARRMFGFIAAGISAGGIVGPALAKFLAVPIGRINLLLVAAAFLAVSLVFVRYLTRWQASVNVSAAADRVDVDRPVGGNPFSGIYQVFGSPYLFGIALFVFLLTWVSTFLYLEQADLVSKAIPDPDQQTAFFSTIDVWVQFITIVIQLVALGHLVSRLGLVVMMVSVPIVMVAGFTWLALSPFLSVLVAVMIIRRVGEYAVMRPCREMLFSTVPRDTKYKAKNFIDTVVYRAGDALSGSAHALLVWLGLATTGIAWAGAGIAALWGFAAYSAARRQENNPAFTSARETVAS
ncbi:MAG TPA: MFS transporter [Steroidobacteraceae bacterium]|nr:MFS transporter [Steroidobacteraceae bacterium]